MEVFIKSIYKKICWIYQGELTTIFAFTKTLTSTSLSTIEGTVTLCKVPLQR